MPSLPLASATAPAPQIEQASPMSTPPPTPTTLATTIPAAVQDNTRAYLGIVPDPTARASTVGVLIQGTQPDSPAEAAGLRAADLIIEIDGRPIANLDRLGQVLDQSRAGQSMTITVLRGVTRMNLTAKLARPPDAER
jgi:S1-C subfamily serine protease